MSFEKRGSALNYAHCRYGSKSSQFRGPERDLSGRYIACLGGSETYGKFVREPFCELLEEGAGFPVANFGCQNAGLDVFLGEPAILSAAHGAELVVLQITGAQNMSNRFYRVHPRRNDRFLEASQVMKMIFREVDFTEFHFTRHMLGSVCARAPDRFALIRDELRTAWVSRMKMLVDRIGTDVVLLWVSDSLPAVGAMAGGLGNDPLFVDRLMLEELRPLVKDIVEVSISPEARKTDAQSLISQDIDRVVAGRLPGALAHQEIAEALLPVIGSIMR